MSGQRIVEPARVGARGIDSTTLIDSADKARALKAAGTDFVLQYLGSVTGTVIDDILSTGMAFMPVTYADKFDGERAVKELAQVGVPKGCTVWLDIEDITNLSAAVVMGYSNDWAKKVQGAGYIAGLYVGAGALLTSEELYALAVTRYWKSMSSVRDRNNQLAEPGCGWCQTQFYPSVMWGGIWSDMNMIGQDFKGRVPTWVRGIPQVPQAHP